MRAWQVVAPGPMGTRPLRAAELPVPEPGPGQVRLRVDACGVCRTDLHLAEGDLVPHRPRTVPGHEVVGRVDALGPGVPAAVDAGPPGVRLGDRLGVAWLASTDGTCAYCARGAENLCPASTYTGWDVDGGYAEYVCVRADYAYRLP
ncbi:alcohol dehydrogenase catalytic domain-containing protein, partial [Frankia sp. AvcI1]